MKKIFPADDGLMRPGMQEARAGTELTWQGVVQDAPARIAVAPVATDGSLSRPHHTDLLTGSRAFQFDKPLAHGNNSEGQLQPADLYQSFHAARLTSTVSTQGNAAGSIRSISQMLQEFFRGLKAISLDNVWYEKWTWLCVAAALLTGFVAPFLMAFEGLDGLDQFTWTFIQYFLIAVFIGDVVCQFLVEYEDPDTGVRVNDFKLIAKYYAKTMLVPDIIFLIPWTTLITEALGVKDSEDDRALLIGLLRLLQLGRMHRFSAFVAMLEYRMVLPQTALVIWRNNLYVLGSTHIVGCLFFLTARMEQFGPNSWIGRHKERFDGLSVSGQYVYSLYFALAAFTGLGDNDFYIASVVEAIIMGCFLLFNLLLSAYILGTVTMLMVKGDKRMKLFRDRITNLRAYAALNSLPKRLQNAMERHNELHFHSDQASDEQVLSIYPQTLRRRVLRHLYRDALNSCYLFKGCTTQLLDLVMMAGRVEQYMPQEQIIAEGDMVNDMFIILEGMADVVTAGRLPPHLRDLINDGPKRAQTAGRALSTAALKRAKTAHVSHAGSTVGPAGGAAALTTGKSADLSHMMSGLSVSAGNVNGRLSAKQSGFASVVSAVMANRKDTLQRQQQDGAIVDVDVKAMVAVGGQNFVAAQQVCSPGLSPSRASRNAYSTRKSSLTFVGVNDADEAGDDSVKGGHGSLRVGRSTSMASGLDRTTTWQSFDERGTNDMDRSGRRDENDTKLTVGSCFGQTSFFAELPSHCSVWSSTVIKVIVISRSVYKEMLDSHAQQTRRFLENLEHHAEEEVRSEILSSLDDVRSLSPDVATALKDLALKDIKPSELSTSVMMEVRDLLSKSQRALLDNLSKVKDALAKYVHKVDQELVYAFLTACADGDAARVRYMLASGMSPNVSDYDHRTGLMLACHCGYEPVARLLLEAGADTQLRDNMNTTAMWECVKMGRDELIELLLGYGATLGMDSDLITHQLCRLIKEGDNKQLQRFIKAGAQVNSSDYSGMTPLNMAAQCSNLAAVKLLVTDGAASLTARNAWGRTPMEEATAQGQTPIAAFLEPLTNSAQQASQQRAKDHDFLASCRNGHTEGVTSELSQGQNPDTSDYDGRSALMLAVQEGKVEVVKLLLQAGADPLLEDKGGHTAMCAAVTERQPALVDVLLQYGGSLSYGHDERKAAAAMARCVAEEDFTQLMLFIKAGAEPDCSDHVGNTSLHMAAALGCFTACRLLVEEANATVNIRNMFGQTPLDCAVAACPEMTAQEASRYEDVILYLETLTAAAQQNKIKSAENPLALPAAVFLRDGGLVRAKDLVSTPPVSKAAVSASDKSDINRSQASAAAGGLNDDETNTKKTAAHSQDLMDHTPDTPTTIKAGFIKSASDYMSSHNVSRVPIQHSIGPSTDGAPRVTRMSQPGQALNKQQSGIQSAAGYDVLGLNTKANGVAGLHSDSTVLRLKPHEADETSGEGVGHHDAILSPSHHKAHAGLASSSGAWPNLQPGTATRILEARLRRSQQGMDPAVVAGAASNAAQQSQDTILTMSRGPSPTPQPLLSRKGSAVRLEWNNRNMSHGGQGRQGAISPTAQAFLEQFDKELGGLADMEGIMESFMPVKATTTAAQATRAISQGAGGSMVHPDHNAAGNVNTAILRRAQRASARIEAAAMMAWLSQAQDLNDGSSPYSALLPSPSIASRKGNFNHGVLSPGENVAAAPSIGQSANSEPPEGAHRASTQEEQQQPSASPAALPSDVVRPVTSAADDGGVVGCGGVAARSGIGRGTPSPLPSVPEDK